MTLVATLKTALTCVALAAVVSPAVAQQARPRPSTKLIEEFGSAKPEEAAPAPAPTQPAPAVDPRRPAAPRTVSYGRVVPPPPRVMSRLARATFSARPAASTSLAVNSRYGVRYDPFTGAARMHTGVDLAAVFGSSVGASMSGAVSYAGPRGGYGNLVVIDHGNGVSTYYAHLSAVAVAAGQPVEAGELVGYVGSTGRSTGPHLHYEVRANGRPFDPFDQVTVFDGGFLAVGGYGI